MIIFAHSQVLVWLDDVGLPTIHQQPEIADCLSKAELYLHHFETGFYSIANVNIRKQYGQACKIYKFYNAA